ncbi:MAG TPA: hypothetical protein PLZ93_04080 [Nocardioides sp.]|uniref:hypothetical protein n=1 Tax=uncultured Nocardioides sp. TaxID=198441 RepID=UPI000EC461A1|nr:hypothetical protein [uncultured Nocardioides sp.]HCB05660.1 hypothetical protein [Nocardioides sp.]HRD59269.1 hypothetical protein [Nocardioides sp.]HRI94768.1 hypothetical protein [Nocardioides sp.]HRK44597.1 hypothetical protein [Nocardioides sp.]
MNTHAEYRRHSYRPPEQPAVTEGDASGSDELARHRDPSLQSAQPSQAQTQKRVAWVRPTELGSYLGPMVGRGIDLQAELVRRARRTPTTTTRTFRHPGPERPATPTRSQEGLGL